MAPAIKIEGPTESALVQAMLAAADLVQVPVDFRAHDGGFAFTTADGDRYENGPLTALRYIAGLRADAPLLGRSYRDETSVDHWVSLVEKEFWVVVSGARAWRAGGAKENVAAPPASLRQNFETAVREKLEPHLLHHTFLACERISIADLLMAAILHAATAVFDDGEKLLAGMENTKRWFELVREQGKMGKYLPKGGAAGASAAAGAGAGAPGAPATASASAATVAPASPAKPAGNPLDQLPPSSFVMDEWKRVYSNTKELKKVAMPWFWEHFDKEGFSLWFMKYDKLPTENKVGYASANMLNGFLQRLDNNFRKYSFAVINVVECAKKEDGFDIQGVWLLRGQELPADLLEHPSFEFHTFTKMDDVKDRARIEDYWCNDDDVENGRAIDSCKVWK